MTLLADDPPPPAPAAAQPWAPAPVAALPLAELRARRAALRAECERARRWERLVQARLDLATDAASPTEALAGALDPVALRALVHGGGGDLADALHDVAAARRELAAYAGAVRGRLEEATDELVARYAADPAGCLGVRRV